MDAKAEKIALFRYGLIAPLVLEPLPRGELTRRAQQLAARHYDIPYSQRTSVSVDTLLSWSLRYRQGGFEALARKPRQDRGHSRTITPPLAELIERLKRENPHRTGTTLLRELALSDNAPGVSASTLYRFLKQRGLTERQLLAGPAHKKFEAQFSNQIWQSDVLCGPWVQRPGGGKRQVFLHATLDDASRLIPHAQFYPHQGLDAFLDCLRQAVAARGLPTRLYVDNAKVYRCQQLARLAASLGILIVHTPPYQRRVLICQFELPLPQFVSRLAVMRRVLGAAADQNLLVDTRAAGHLLSAPQGLHHFVAAAHAAAAEVILLDPLYSTHDQDENDTRAMAALCQSLLRLRDASRAALIVVHHVRKSVSREEIGSAFRGSSALHAVGDSYLLLARPSSQLPAIELRFQFRYAAPPPPRLLQLDAHTLWFSPAGPAPAHAAARRKVEKTEVTQALVGLGGQGRYSQLREALMHRTDCSKRTAQLAIAGACQQGWIVQAQGHYRLPFSTSS